MDQGTDCGFFGSGEKVANIQWAQRSSLILLKVEVQEATQHKVELTADTLTITATSKSGENYKTVVELFSEAVPDVSKWRVNIWWIMEVC